MTRWLDPVELAKTGWRTVTARHADRARETLEDQEVPVARYGDGEEDVWFDYVADLGDSFDPTMAVAWHLGRSSLHLDPDPLGEAPPPPAAGLPRGRFLVMGGDQVYPYASPRRYANQTVGPYSLAFEGDATADLYAIPGNHDWYGTLDPFRSVFCDGSDIGRWKTRQKASWFALQLPKGWWLWGIDTGLTETVNPAQHAYFTRAAAALEKGDRIIVCTPKPLWAMYDRHRDALDVLERFLDEIIGERAGVPLFLSGDTHAFASFWRGGIGKVAHVTSGGGGAFLHPTHHMLADPQSLALPEFQLIKAWPSAERSSELARPSFVTTMDRQSRLLVPLVALLHLAYAGLTTARWPFWIDDPASFSPLAALAWVLSAPLSWPMLVLVFVIDVLAVEPNTSSPLVKRAARRRGAILGVEQVIVFVAAAAAGRFMAEHGVDHPLARFGWMIVASLVGSIASLMLLSWVLARANRVMDVGDNLVFSAKHLGWYEHFVRCRVDGRTGQLDLFVVGLADPGRGWVDAMATADGGPPPSCSSPTYVWGRTFAP